MLEVPKIKFFNGQEIPVIGFGTWQIRDDEGKKALNLALECGYRHIDTATVYRNEEAIGEVLHEWISQGKVKREDLFITTKLPMVGNRPGDVERFLNSSLKKLRLSYVDLYLIHCPVAMKGKNDEDCLPLGPDGNVILDSIDLPSVWKAMEDQVDAGRAKSIGISNFNSVQVEKVANNCRILPANNQVELHAYHQQKDLRAVCEKYKISVCAFAPLGAPYIQESPGEHRLLENPVVTSMASRVGKTPAQILLRHLIQHQLIVIPKSANPNRIKENLQVFDFELTKEDMKALDNLDLGRAGKMFIYKDEMPGIEKHPEYPFNIPF